MNEVYVNPDPDVNDILRKEFGCRPAQSDLISRQAAIDFIDAGHLCNPNEPRWSDNEVVNFLKSRPPAQLEIIRCKECIYGERDDDGRWYCRSLGCQIGNEDGSGYCSDAERRSDGVDR